MVYFDLCQRFNLNVLASGFTFVSVFFKFTQARRETPREEGDKEETHIHEKAQRMAKHLRICENPDTGNIYSLEHRLNI